MVNPFEWIKARVRQSVVDGFAEGLAVIDPAAAPAPAAQIEVLEQRLALTVAKDGKARGKAGDK